MDSSRESRDFSASDAPRVTVAAPASTTDHVVTAPPRSLVTDAVLGALRLVAALMFMQHGVQKLFGWLLPPDRPFMGAPEMYSQMWFAGILEVCGGFLLALGLFTRPVAFILAGQMAFAYFIAHAPRGFWPILNQGELAALYCFVFLAFSVLGAGRFSLDGLLNRRTEQRLTREVPRQPEPFPNDRRKSRRRGEAPRP